MVEYYVECCKFLLMSFQPTLNSSHDLALKSVVWVPVMFSRV
jgi:hypothetical protein